MYMFRWLLFGNNDQHNLKQWLIMEAEM